MRSIEAPATTVSINGWGFAMLQFRRADSSQQLKLSGNTSLGVRESTSNGTSSPGQCEDCLFLGIYAPGNATTVSNLPVLIYLQGGGFISNAGTNDGGSLIKASGMQTVVNLNYRVEPYGFLASDEFGGNPNHVVLGGSSVGAASVTLQVAVYSSNDEVFLHATAAESHSFNALRTVDELLYQHDQLVTRTKCDSSHIGSEDTLTCLRNLNSDDLQGQNFGTPFPTISRPPLFAYSPTLVYDFMPDYTLDLLSSGCFLKLPAIYGDTTNGGTISVPPSTDTTEMSNDWLQAQFPALNTTQKTWFQRTYPPPIKQPDSSMMRRVNYWSFTADAYGEINYICPGLFLNNVYTRHSVKSHWNYPFRCYRWVPHGRNCAAWEPLAAEGIGMGLSTLEMPQTGSVLHMYLS
ncbi:MAG: hypothetical protein LQ337_001334 [Flavoplaca oasis]|nr:MAG: hypothetical protein LQ337_001334 [Flavoplaca oasis]